MPIPLKESSPLNWHTLWPCLLALILLFSLSVVPLDFGILKIARPLFLVIATYYWALFRPNFLRVFGWFIVGFLYDIISFTPLGFTSILLITVYLIIYYQRPVLIKQPFGILWGVFTVFLCGVSAISWGAASLIRLNVMPVTPFIIECLMTILSFPLVIMILKIGNPPLERRLDKN